MQLAVLVPISTTLVFGLGVCACRAWGINTWDTMRAPLDRVETAALIGIGVYAYINGTGPSGAWTGSLYVDAVSIQ